MSWQDAPRKFGGAPRGGPTMGILRTGGSKATLIVGFGTAAPPAFVLGARAWYQLGTGAHEGLIRFHLSSSGNKLMARRDKSSRVELRVAIPEAFGMRRPCKPQPMTTVEAGEDFVVFRLPDLRAAPPPDRKPRRVMNGRLPRPGAVGVAARAERKLLPGRT